MKKDQELLGKRPITFKEMTVESLKNQNQAEFQITAEQIVSDPNLHWLENVQMPRTNFIDETEL